MKTMEAMARSWVVADLAAPRLGLRESLRAFWALAVVEPMRRRRAREAARWAAREVELRRAYFLAIGGGVR